MMLTKEQKNQIDLQINAYENQITPAIVKVEVNELELIIDPYVANPNIMNSGVQIVQYLCNNSHIVKGKVVTDMGTGCGIIGISAALLGAKKVDMIDIDQRAVKNAEKNISKYNLKNKCAVFRSDLFNEFNSEELADVQIFNHPYFPVEPIKGKKWTRMMFGGASLMANYFEQAPKYSAKNALYIFSWFPLADNESGLDNNPAKRATECGYEIVKTTEQQPVRQGIQQFPFKIFELRKLY